MIYILESIKGKNAHFASATEKIDTSSAMGILLFHIFAAIAQFESMQIGERVSHGM
jgi:DNA invertase Pin-like site-specific DNA recombinase